MALECYNRDMFGKILLFQKTGTGDDTLTYEIPKNFGHIECGTLVEIPLRKGNVAGIFLEKTESAVAKGKIKFISRILHPKILENWQLDLLDWLAAKYAAPKWNIARQFIPAHIREGKITPEQPAMQKKINSEKKEIYELIHDRQIFLDTLRRYVRDNKTGQTLIITPEIALPSFWSTHIENLPGSMNAGKAKTVKQKSLLWKEIFEGKYSTVIASRSGFLAPLKNLTQIIIINEHHIGHREERRPKFHSRDIAKFIAEKESIGLVHLSTSVSMTAWHAEKAIKISRRTDIRTEIIDMKQERRKGNTLPLSEKLLESLKKNLQEKKQAIVYLNKTGEAACLVCRDCGHIPKCAVCNRNLIVKKNAGQERILYCIAGDKAQKIPEGCPCCGSLEIRMIGTGQEKIEEILKNTFPKAKIARFSKNIAVNIKTQEKILKEFRDKKIDILITTRLLQSMADIPETPILALLDIDSALGSPRFQAGEKAIHQLQEASALVEKNGQYIIETYMPQVEPLKFYRENNLQNWYDIEYATRKKLNYPPWSSIVFLRAAKQERARDTLSSTMSYLKTTRPHLQMQQTVKMLGHNPKQFLVIRGTRSEEDMEAIKKMPDVILDIDSPYLI